ncbi:MAG TPA: biotin/lipoyl-containing protein [Pyrinomonadaceae bacterium]|nr:biotin/lipoyl-containing protein [Pyrinomonadaceae bacterium]
MKSIAEINGERIQVEWTREGEDVRAVCNGRAYELTIRQLGPDVLLMTRGRRVAEARVRRGSEPDVYEVGLGHQSFAVALVDPKRLPRGGGAGRGAGGHSSIVAPMPGKVVRVLVEQGAEVAAGEGVLVVEAMKMQNEMKAPRAGRVSELRVAAGTTVGAGEILAVIE